MFPNDASEFTYVRSYSRWIESLSRRETWPETVERYITFLLKHQGDKIPPKVIKKIRQRLIAFEVMPSMRALWAAGDAAEADNTTLYNCSYASTTDPIAFAEALYILMCGTGYGYGVQQEHVDQLPEVPKIQLLVDRHYTVEDHKAGWADSVKELVTSLYAGLDVKMIYDKIRPEGSRLKTMGGRASGPAPLITLHNFIRKTFQDAQGRRLTTLEVSDIKNQIAEIVVVGGVRRSSEISLSDLNDALMRSAKDGEFPVKRWMSNNSAVYLKKPTAVEFLQEWGALAASGRGERGIFNLEGVRTCTPIRRNSGLIVGCNPCAEIALRNKQFCNLSEVVIRASDDLDELLDKVETATWIGAIQSTFTYFPYLGKEWKENCEEERLLGVSLTGQMDAPHLLTPDALRAMKSRAIKTAKKASQALGINMPAAITCVKPSGTVSQLVDSASGMHSRHAPFYIRRYRIAATDPFFKMIRDQGIAVSPENGQGKSDWTKAQKLYEASADAARVANVSSIFRAGEEWSEDKVNTWVVMFPVKSPKNAITTGDISAMDQLEHYKKVQTNWCEHNASMTVYVKDEEWFEVGNWVYKNWNIVNGIAFLPYDNSKYEQKPYEAISEEKYNEMVKKFKKIDYSQLSQYEKEDNTSGSKTLACSGNSCEIP